MEKIFNTFHIYDIMAYLIPGIFTISYILLGIYIYGNSIKIINVNILTESVIFLISCYYIGIIIQELGYILEKKELKYLYKDTYSNNLLLKKSKLINMCDKQKCWQILQKEFNITPNLNFKSKIKRNKQIEQYSQLCYERFRERLKDDYKNSNQLNQSEIFNIHYGMSRNLLATTLLAIIYFELLSLYSILKIYTYRSFIYILVTFLAYVCSKMLYRRTQKYAKYHVKNVVTLYLARTGR